SLCDWSPDVCSSDLELSAALQDIVGVAQAGGQLPGRRESPVRLREGRIGVVMHFRLAEKIYLSRIRSGRNCCTSGVESHRRRKLRLIGQVPVSGTLSVSLIVLEQAENPLQW